MKINESLKEVFYSLVSKFSQSQGKGSNVRFANLFDLHVM